MLPCPPPVAKCRQCGTFLWVEDAPKIGEVDQWPTDEEKVPNAWKEAPQIEELSEEEYYQALEAGLGSTREREKQLRTLAWWRSNDPYRRYDAADQEAEYVCSEACVANMRELFELLSVDRHEGLMKAELARVCGDFPDALDLLEQVTHEELQPAKGQMMELCQQKCSSLQLLSETD